MAIMIGPGQGDSLVLYDHNKNYNEVLVQPTSADLFWSYVDEPASASRFLSTVPLGIEVSVPLSTEVDRDIVIRAIPRTAYSRNPSSQDLDTAEQATGISTRHDATPVLGIVGKVGTRHARISIDNWNRFARVRRVDISTHSDFPSTDEYTSVYFDLDQTSATLGGAGTASEFNELPDYFDLDRSLPAYPDPVDPDGIIYYVRVAHSAESSARATGATYKEKVDSLRFTEFSEVLEISFQHAITGAGGSPGTSGIGPSTSFQYPTLVGDSGAIGDVGIGANHLRHADAYGPGILSNDAVYGQYIGGRKLWTSQQVHAQGAIADWMRDEGPYRPLTLGGLSPGVRDNPSLPAGSPLVYGAGSLPALQGMMSYTNFLEPSSFVFYRATHNGSGAVDDPIYPDTGIGRFSAAAWTEDAWRYSGRIDFTLIGTSSVDGDDVNVPVAVDIYGGFLSSTTSDATGIRGLRVDQYGNAVLGVSAPAAAATSGFPYIPTFAATPTGTPVATLAGYSPIGAFGSSIYMWNGSAWVASSGGSAASPDTSVQFNNAGAFGGSANFTWANASSLATITGRLAVTHSSATLANLGLSVASTLTGSNTDSALYAANQIALDDQNTVEVAGGRATLLVRHTRSAALSPGATHAGYGLVSDLLYTAATGTFDGPFVAYKSQVTVTAGGTLTSYIGFYAQKPGIFDSVTNKYGFIAESDLFNGFGTTSPTATLHASGSARLDLGSDATGDILYRSSGGNLARLPVGTNGHVLTLASGLPSWAAASAAPGGSNTQIQYNNSGAFGGAANFTWDNTNSLATVTGRLAVTYSTTSITTRALTSALTLTGSSIDTANLYYANLLSLTDQNTGDGSLVTRANLVARYTRANVANDLAVAIGVVADMQMTSGSGTYNGAMIGFRAQVTATSGGTLTTSTGFYAQKAPLFADSITNLYGFVAESGMLNGFGTTSPTATLHVSGTTKFTLGSDATGDIWYRNSSGFFTRLGVGTNGHVLTLASGLPSWAAAAGGSPGGSNTQIQYNSSGSFAGAANFTWDNGNSLATLTGRLIITHSSATLTNRGIFVDSTLTGSNTQGSLYYANLLSLTDQSTAGTGTDERAAILFRYTRASASDDFSSAYGVVSEMLLTATSGTFTGTFTAYKAQGEIAPGTTLTTYAGYYAAYPGGFGDLTNVYGFVAEGGMNNGFGTTSPTATLHVSGTVKIDLGSDGTGDIFYRNSGGTLSRLAVGTNGHVLTLACGLPSWAAAGAGSSSWNGITNPTGNQALTMAAHTSTWTWNAATSSNNLFTITNTSNDTGTGFLVSIETPGGSNAKSPLRVSAQGSEALHVDPDGKFIWGSTANYTTLGLSSQQLAIVANGSSGLNILCAGSTSNTPRVIFHKAANTPASPQIVTSSDIIGNLQFNAFDGSIYQQAAGIQALMDGTPGANDLPAALRFLTTADGASSSSVRMIIKSTGRVGIATSTPGAMLHVNGTAQFDLGSDATGDIWYRNSSGLMTRLGVGTNGHVLTLASGLPSWAAAAGGGSPGGSNTQIQYNSSGSFAGAANFTWDNGNSIAAVTGRLSVTHSSATLTNRGAFIDSTLTGSNTQGSLYYANLISLTDQSTAGFSLDERTAMLFRYVRASSVDDFSFAYGVVSEMQLTAGSGTLSTNYVAYKAMGSVASGATLSAFTGFYAESPTGSGTLTNFYGFASDPGAKHGFGISTPGYTIDAAYFPTATTGRNVLANYSVWSQGTAADGFGLSVLYKLGSTTTERLAANFDVYWQESTDASRSAVASISTVHKAQTAAIQRQLWGGHKDLVDNTRTDIFSVTFGTSDHKAVGGVVHMTVFAKQVSGSNQIQMYRKSIPFLAAHNAATNTGFGIWGGEFGALGGVTTGSISFTFECNTVAFSSYALNANTYTYQLTANSDLTTISEFFVHYNIEYNGEAEVSLAP